MIDPVIEDLTMSISPSVMRKIAVINSAALPNVAFRNPPTLGPEWRASSSVAFPMNPARGMIAIAEETKRSCRLPRFWQRSRRGARSIPRRACSLRISRVSGVQAPTVCLLQLFTSGRTSVPNRSSDRMTLSCGRCPACTRSNTRSTPMS